jgi:hypothetical protein
MMRMGRTGGPFPLVLHAVVGQALADQFANLEGRQLVWFTLKAVELAEMEQLPEVVICMSRNGARAGHCFF